ncbi:MAG: ATP-binding cassette domain-containing protein [Desulfovibrionaceae bacterium]
MIVAEPAPIITLQDVVKVFPTAPPTTPPALGGISAFVPSGAIVGLVGPDAAGKTTLMRLLAGLLLPTSGSISMATTDIGYMPQRFGLYEDLSVLDNLTLHAELRGLEGAKRTQMFGTLLTFTALTPFVNRLAGKLSGGMKQKLGLACALLTTPRLLLLDEPGVGVDPLSRRELWRMVHQLAGKGMSVVWSTSYMDEAQRCSHVLMLEQGRLVYEGAPQTLMQRVQGRVFQVQAAASGTARMLAALSQSAGVRDALIQGSKIRLLLAPDADKARIAAQAGGQLCTVAPCLEDAYMDTVGGIDQRPSPFADILQTQRVCARGGDAPPIIVAEGLTRLFGDFVAANNISFSVGAGKIFGLLGPNGAGKSTTFRMLCGLLRPTRGACFVAGTNLLKAREAARAKLGYMAQKFSLYGELTVQQNMNLMADLYDIPRQEQRSRIEQRMEALDIAPFAKVQAGDLPLGHKQRLAMACATLHNPPVLFLDEPTSGVDPRTRRDFWKHISAMTQNGVAVLVTTHFMEEAEYCDEIALIIHGSMIARGTPDDLKTRCPHQFLDAGRSDPTLEDAFIAYIQADNAAPHEGHA